MRRLSFMITTSCALALGACIQAPDTDEQLVDQVEQGLADPASVLGFESVADWTVAGATKSASADPSEGASALALRNFAFAELRSVPLTTVSGVTSKLAFDLKPPESPDFGNAQLYVNIPSRGVHSALLGQVSLKDLPAGAYSTLSFDVPPNVVTALQEAYSDLTFKIVLNVPHSTADYLVDHLHFVGGTPPGGASKVELRVSGSDDRVVVSVNGLQRRMFHIGEASLGQRIDVSDWFGSGVNDLRVQLLNTGGPAASGVELWVDDQPVVNEACPATVCNGLDVRKGIVWDRTFSVSTPDRPAFQPVTVTGDGGQPGKVYVNDVFTGLVTPTTLSLPPGDYTIGVGFGSELPPADYTGSFFEQQVTVGASPVAVDITATPQLPFQEETRIAILPIRNSINHVASLGGPDPSNTGVLADADITALEAQVRATNDLWFEPLSYGLARWTVEVLPTIEDVPIIEQNHDGWDTTRFIAEAGTGSLASQYDMVVYFFSQHRADGSPVERVSNIAWAFDGTNIGFSTSFTSVGPDLLNAAFLHETLHNYESYNENQLRLYNGIEGLHGAEQHGYYSGSRGEEDYVHFYRHFMRGQVAELGAMRSDLKWPAIGEVAASSDLYLGVFPVLRRGFRVP
ncbi:hypothetical protein WMF04_40625 [Sorangium sp. So ce260]|uniref:hypothetical protein n=1 Tax=Sorangium sp. So ce260 TaxID=3133291 RepID=UPI003F621FD9